MGTHVGGLGTPFVPKRYHHAKSARNARRNAKRNVVLEKSDTKLVLELLGREIHA